MFESLNTAITPPVSSRDLLIRLLTAMAAADTASGCTMTLRVALGHDIGASVRGPFAAHLSRPRVRSIATLTQGSALDASSSMDFAPAGTAEAVLRTRNRTGGVQD